MIFKKKTSQLLKTCWHSKKTIKKLEEKPVFENILMLIKQFNFPNIYQRAKFKHVFRKRTKGRCESAPCEFIFKLHWIWGVELDAEMHGGE